ncbi:MAG: hypothetical protein GY868_18105 [Deltaproteobacteria bacterium]|nr:hypothetical protein [Deltaproteobacteria bacterium]
MAPRSAGHNSSLPEGGGATSTFDEAYDLKEFCSEKSFRHLIIVTDNHHTRRSLYAFRKVFRGTGIRLESMGASNDIFNERNWWRSDRGLAAYIMEGVKYLVYVCSSRNVAVIKNY